jgi:hypothetical protein
MSLLLDPTVVAECWKQSNPVSAHVGGVIA